MMELKELQKNWKLVKLEELCEEDPGTKDPSLEPDKSFIYVDISSVDNVTKRIVTPQTLLGKDAPSRARKVIRTNDVIVSTTRPNLNAVALVPPDLDGQICSTGFCVLRANSDLDPKYLFSFVQSARFIDSLTNLVSGALYPAVNDGQVFSQLIPLPLSEQKAIASRLSRQMEEIERMRRAAERQLDAAKTFRGSILADIFNSDDAQDWEMTKLDDVSNVVGGLQKTPERQPRKFHVPYLRVENVQRGNIDFTEISRFEVTPAELERLRLQNGDLLVVEGNGSSDQIGRCAIFKSEVADCIHQNHLIRVRTDKAKLLPEFLEYFINSPEGMAEMLAQAETTSGLYNLSSGKIKALEVPVPSTIDEQIKICKKIQERLSTSASITGTTEKQLEAINALPKAYLREVFGIFESPELDERPDIDDEAEEWEEEDEQED